MWVRLGFLFCFLQSDMSVSIFELENTSTVPLETACFYLNAVLLCLVSELKREPGMNRK